MGGSCWVSICDAQDDIHSFGNATEDGMTAVEVGSSNVRDEELTAIGVRTSVCHGDDTWAIVMQAEGTWLVFE